MTAAFITGSSRGIGAATAVLFAQRGIDVAVHYRRDATAAEEVAAAVRTAGRRAVVVRAELAQEAEVRGAVAAAAAALGGLDIVVANAAASAFKPLLAMRAHHLGATFDTIAASFVHLVQAATPFLAEAGEPGGRIVTVSGFDTIRVLPDHGLLAAAKAALEQLTRYLAVELAPQATTVNAVVPGFVDTDSARLYADTSYPGGFAAAAQAWSAATPAGRLATAEDIAKVIALLCSPDASWITGQIIVADGGLTLP